MANDDTPTNDRYSRPEGASDELVEAVGRVTESLAMVERARGSLYNFHRLIGDADFKLDEAVSLFRKAGHDEMADMIERDLIGRNVLEGRWTFQVVNEFDENYWEFFRHVEKTVRDRLLDGKQNIFEAELKESRRTRGHKHHESRP
jgi:hypothetical protein